MMRAVDEALLNATLQFIGALTVLPPGKTVGDAFMLLDQLRAVQPVDEQEPVPVSAPPTSAGAAFAGEE